MANTVKSQKESSNTIKVCWVSGIPAHYIRAMHRKLDTEFTKKIKFLYLEKQKISLEREYERGEFPDSCSFIKSSKWIGIWKYLELVSPEIVILAGHYPRSIIVAIIWAKLNRRRILYWADTNILDLYQKSKLKRTIEIIGKRLLFKWIDTFLYQGTRNRDFYEMLLGREYLKGRLFKVPLPALISPTIKQGTENNNYIRLLYVGRLVSLKCVDNLIKAFASLPDQIRRQAILTVIGDGPERERLIFLAKKLGVSNQIRFPGMLPSDEIGNEYQKHAVFVLPSGYEAWGLVVNEALGAHLPVIAPYWIGSVADLVIDNFSGIVMSDNSPETIKRALLKVMLLDNDKLNQMGKHGHEIVMAGDFNMEGATRRLIEFINNATA